MSLRRNAVVSVLMLLTLASAPQIAQAQILYLTFQAPGTFAGTSFSAGDIVRYDNVSNTSSIFLDASAHFSPGKLGGGIDGLEVLPDGTLYLSTFHTAKIPAIGVFQRNDVIHYDPVTQTGSVAIDGATHFLNKGLSENIDVIDTLADGSFLLSTRNAAIFKGLSIADGGQIFRYDPVSDSASLFFDGSAQFKRPLDIDAFEILSDGRYLFSVAREHETTLAGLKINDADIAVYDPITNTVAIYLDHNDIADWTGKHRDLKGIGTDNDNPPPPVIPEPFSASLFGLGLGALGWARRRQSLRQS